MSIDTRPYKIGPFVITVPVRSCYFCKHCTDIFWDYYTKGPYTLFCEEELDIANGMRGTCSRFDEEDFDAERE